MLIKLRPEDFVVEEQSDFEPREHGKISVYELRKRKIDTFEAIRRLAAKARLPLNAFSTIGLKDRQAVTTQLISVEGRVETTLRIAGVKLRYLGRTGEHLSAKNLKGNVFKIVVRDLSARDVKELSARLERTLAHGLINYFDDQRFGTIVAGQGMPGRFLAHGDFEAAVRAMVATPGLRDPDSEKRFKHLVTKRWGQWEELSKRWGGRRGAGMIRHLARRPTDFKGALRNYPGKERAIHVFAYQSLIWNRSVARYLEAKTPAAQRSTSPYAAGKHTWLEYAARASLPELVESFPLLDHTVCPEDPAVRAAIDDVLSAEGLTVEAFRIKGIRGCFFKHYERPLRVWPQNLRRLGQAEQDAERPGRLCVRLRFELPPGSYATLLLKRLFGREPQAAKEKKREERRRKKKKDARGDGGKSRGRGEAEGVAKPRRGGTSGQPTPKGVRADRDVDKPGEPKPKAKKKPRELKPKAKKKPREQKPKGKKRGEEKESRKARKAAKKRGEEKTTRKQKKGAKKKGARKKGARKKGARKREPAKSSARGRPTKRAKKKQHRKGQGKTP